eukprot:TRINITY_DN6816_c0_g1_i1.p1 TRINITY_DN6816_c0_g1~~TRINITY_DN6816_c0_g1_i1.p1  ORF type:complete len:197 (-),score=29.97 TRINITY_DN6816_c0_g1_i1:265-855(-)
MISGIGGTKKTNRLLEELVSFIKQMGGSVVQGGPFPVKGGKMIGNIFIPPVIMLSPCPLRTVKYLTALGLAVPCLHYNWIFHVYENSALYDLHYYQLPSGITLNKKTISQRTSVFLRYPSPIESKTFYDARKCRSYRIEISGDKGFKTAWKEILRSGGARVVERLFRSNAHSIDVFLLYANLTCSTFFHNMNHLPI